MKKICGLLMLTLAALALAENAVAKVNDDDARIDSSPAEEENSGRPWSPILISFHSLMHGINFKDVWYSLRRLPYLL